MPLSPEEEAEYQALRGEVGGSEGGTGALERVGRGLWNLPKNARQVLTNSVIGAGGMLTGQPVENIRRGQEAANSFIDRTPGLNTLLGGGVAPVAPSKGTPQGLGQQAAELLTVDVAPHLLAAAAVPVTRATGLLGRVSNDAIRGAVLGAGSGDLAETAKSAAMWGAVGGIAGIPGKTLARGLLRTGGQASVPVAAAAIDPNQEVMSKETLVNAALMGGFGALTDPQLGGRLAKSLLRRPAAAPETPVEPLGPQNPYEVAPPGYSTPLLRPRAKTEWELRQEQAKGRVEPESGLSQAPEEFAGDVFAGVPQPRRLLRPESTQTRPIEPPPVATPAQPEGVPPGGNALRSPTDIPAQGKPARTPAEQAEVAKLNEEIDAILQRHRLARDNPAEQSRLWKESEKRSMRLRELGEEGSVSPSTLMSIAGGSGGALYGYSTGEDEQDRLTRAATFGAMGAGLPLLKKALPSGMEARRILADRINRSDAPRGWFKDKQAKAIDLFNSGRQEGTFRAQERAKGISAEAIRPASTATAALRTPAMEAVRANPSQLKAADDFVNSDGANEAALRAAVPDKTVADALIESKKAQVKLQKIIRDAESQPRADMIDNSMGTYGRRAFRVDLDPENWVKDDALFQKVVDQWHAAAPKLDRGEVMGTLDAYLASRKSGSNFTPQSSNKISQQLYIAKKPLTPELKALLGEVTDPMERQILTTQKLSRSGKQAEFINQVSGTKRDDGIPYVLDYTSLDAARKAGNDVSDYVRLPDSKSFGKLANKYVPVDVQRVLDPPPPGWLDALGKIPYLSPASGWAKEAVTVMNPATHARQLVQTPLFLLASRANPKFLPDAFKALSDPNSAISKMLREEHIIGASFAHNDFAKLATETGKSPGVVNRIRDFMRKLYSIPDDGVRALTYLTALKRFAGDKNKALDFTNARTTNYGAVNPLTKGLRNLPVVTPFITFTSEILRISKNLAKETVHGKTVVDKAMAAAGLAGLFGVGMGLDAATRAALNPEERKEWDSMEKMMPDYQRYQAKAIGDKNKFGARNFVGMSSLTPGGDILTLAKMLNDGNLTSLVEQNPFVGIKAPMWAAGADIVRGENAFTQQPVKTGKEKLLRAAEVFIPPIIPPGYEGKKIAALLKGGGSVENPSTGSEDTTGKALKRNLLGITVQSAKRSTLLRRTSFKKDEELRRINNRAQSEHRVAKSPEEHSKINQRAQERRKQLLKTFSDKVKL